MNPKIHLLILLLLSLFSCKYKYPANFDASLANTTINPASVYDTISRDETEEDFTDSSEYQQEPFQFLSLYPVIKDSIKFVKSLRSNCHLAQHERNMHITTFLKTKLYGSANTFYLIEYSWFSGPSCEFPWKKQILFDKSGQLVTIFNALRFQLIEIFPGRNPLLLNCYSTARGNGIHEIIRINGRRTENVYDGFKDIRPQTYDSGEDLNINEPNELSLKINDINHDGYNDISFCGVIKHDPDEAGARIKRIAVRFNFIYNKKNGHFIEQEDYSKKYSYLEE